MFPIRDTIRSKSIPLVNLTIIAANVLVFIFQSTLSRRGFMSSIETFGLVPAQFSISRPYEFLTILSSMFMHGGWFHLISNMWILYIFGDNVEDRMGSGRYLIFYLVAGAIAAGTHIFFMPGLRQPTVGASGAVAGVLGAYFLLFPQSRVVTFIPIFFLPWFVQIPAFFYLGIWFLSQLANGLMVDQGLTGIAWWAHIGGFVTGIVLVRLFERPKRIEIAYHQGDSWQR